MAKKKETEMNITDEEVLENTEAIAFNIEEDSVAAELEDTPAAAAVETEKRHEYEVIAGTYGTRLFAELIQADLRHRGISSTVKALGNEYEVRCGTYAIRQNAANLSGKLIRLGYKATTQNI